MSMFDEFATKFNNRDGAEVQWKIHNLHNQVCTYTDHMERIVLKYENHKLRERIVKTLTRN